MDQEQHTGNDQPVAFSEPPAERSFAAPPIKHSGLGITATVLGSLAIIFILTGYGMVFANADLLNSFDPDTFDPDHITAEEQDIIMTMSFIGLLFLGAVLLTIIGLIMGIISLVKKNRKRLYPILGTILCISPIILLIVGSMLGSVLS